ncbi:GMC oxidoreductase-domain-containing protein [Desarmillaria tabescens]|uniref:GMC oxidoreductase-domain-containing protein n=1 Tax=Armillaria tabescens TaxID=1929756 RepID=A0AA39T7D5_ARMTA|nr:GMC oxidoreductase-domain-containing protein [Desarmillaria tabescens]KAK0469586.1 GMC oxidoreductase-domain-containing protein [Desarmillaria tabescens]
MTLEGGDHERYDIIFAGGGTGGCVAAGRLAAADPSLKILVLEAGPHIRDAQDHIQPARYFRNLALAKETFTFHVGKPSESIAGRSPIVPSAKCVGGGSGVNFVMYTRASASDYDDWENIGNPGWGSDDLIPLASRAENYQCGTGNTHGTSGPISVSSENPVGVFGQQYLAIAAKYDKDRDFTEDPNDFKSCNEYGPWRKYIGSASGRRSDTAHHYIYNQEHNSNLQVLDKRRVIRVIFDNKRAVGVEYADEVDNTAAEMPDVRQAFASRLVVLSAGAFGSPSILERSGIGASEVLQRNDIPQLVELPGVGENYNDHNLVFVPYYADESSDTLDDIFHGDPTAIASLVHAEQWRKDGTGLMASNGIDAGIKIRPTEKDLKVLGPTFAKRWNDFFLNAPDKPVMWIGPASVYCITDPPRQPGRKFFSIGYYTEYPASLGRVHIQAGLNPYAPLDFETGFLDDPADLVVLRWAYKHGRELARRMDAYRGCCVPAHPKFPKGNEAALELQAQSPIAVSAPDINYTAEDDFAIDEYHRLNVKTAWHSLGTCAMKRRSERGVVDSHLNVYGVENLKVVDMSIAPSNVGANTYNTALVIGEKAALIIGGELGIKGI